VIRIQTSTLDVLALFLARSDSFSLPLFRCDGFLERADVRMFAGSTSCRGRPFLVVFEVVVDSAGMSSMLSEAPDGQSGQIGGSISH
jgi:hypothetical protein